MICEYFKTDRNPVLCVLNKLRQTWLTFGVPWRSSLNILQIISATGMDKMYEICCKHISRKTSPVCCYFLSAPIIVEVRIDNDISTLHIVETLYSTIYYSKYFIELHIDESTQYVALWTHKRHPIPRPFGRAMECLLWVLQQKLIVL